MRDRLRDNETKMWSESTLCILSKAFPYKSDDVQTWYLSERLLPHALAAAEHAENLMVATEDTGYILNLTGLYLKDHAEFSEAKANFERALSI